MKKMSVIFKGVWNDVPVIGYRVIGDIQKEFNFYEHKEAIDTICFDKDNKYTLKTQTEITVSILKEGKGIIYKDYVMFDVSNENPNRIKFEKRYKEIKGQYERFLNGTLCKYIYDYRNVPVIKFAITMYQNKIFSEAKLLDRLNLYVMKEGINEIFQEIKNELGRVA